MYCSGCFAVACSVCIVLDIICSVGGCQYGRDLLMGGIARPGPKYWGQGRVL